MNEWPLLEGVSFWTVGNGTKIRARHDCRVAPGFILKDFMHNNIFYQFNVTIAETTTDSGEWH